MELADVTLFHRRYDFIIQMSCKSVNHAVSPDGQAPTLLVYGAIPRHGVMGEGPTPTNLERAKAERKVTETLKMLSARRKVNEALRPGRTPDVTKTRTLPLSILVILFSKRLHKWDGPFHVIDGNSDTITLLLPSPAGHLNSEALLSVHTYLLIPFLCYRRLI